MLPCIIPQTGGCRLLHAALRLYFVQIALVQVYIQGQKAGRWPPSFPLIVTKSVAACGVFWPLIKPVDRLCPLRLPRLFVESRTAADRKGVGRDSLAVNERCVLKRLTAQRGEHDAACRWITSDQRLGFTREYLYTPRPRQASHDRENSLPVCFFSLLLLQPLQQQNTKYDLNCANKGGQDSSCS